MKSYNEDDYVVSFRLTSCCMSPAVAWFVGVCDANADAIAWLKKSAVIAVCPGETTRGREAACKGVTACGEETACGEGTT